MRKIKHTAKRNLKRPRLRGMHAAVMGSKKKWHRYYSAAIGRIMARDIDRGFDLFAPGNYYDAFAAPYGNATDAEVAAVTEEHRAGGLIVENCECDACNQYRQEGRGYADA